MFLKISHLNFLVLISVMCSSAILPNLLRHPLDPLTPQEIKRTAEIIKEKYPGKNWSFMGILLNEPLKSELYPFLTAENNGVPSLLTTALENLPRKSFVVLYEFGSGRLHDAVVNLDTNTVERFKKIEQGAKPNYRTEFFSKWSAIVMNDTRVQDKVESQGYELGSVVPYCTAYFSFEYPNKYLCHFLFYAQEFYNDNYYAHPFGFTLVFDINEEKILSIDEAAGNNRVPRGLSNYEPSVPGFHPGYLRKDLKPLNLQFPNGPSYKVKGNVISWQKFKFRISFNYREGLVLHNVVYKDGKKIRPLFYRLSVSELSVSYGDPRSPYNRKQYFDESSYGLGNPPNSLVAGEDCIGATKFFNVTIPTADGSYQKIMNGICLSEEDDGILWKHTNSFTNSKRVTRSRRLTLTQLTTVDNYEYIFLWHFYQDATIKFEVHATGIVQTQLDSGGARSHGTQVFPQVNAPYHQHIFAVRIDPMIDGLKNTVSTLDVIPSPGATGSPGNPYGNGITVQETKLKTAGQARTDVNREKSRVWKICNDDSIHPYTNEPMGYKLIPMNTPPLIMKEDSPVRKLNKFAEHSVWVTPYKDFSHFINGFYVGHHTLADWVEQNEDAKVENQDIVLWHTFTHVHVPRVEDFPVMPQEGTGFTLKPYNFFLENPALDVP